MSSRGRAPSAGRGHSPCGRSRRNFIAAASLPSVSFGGDRCRVSRARRLYFAVRGKISTAHVCPLTQMHGCVTDFVCGNSCYTSHGCVYRLCVLQ
ncbi:MAG: hypothetical protein RSD01_08530 [Ruthenibacterium sp.]